MATHTGTKGFGELDPAIKKLEFKVTVMPAEEPKVQAELRRAKNPAFPPFQHASADLIAAIALH